jgi:hypothetical protein
MHVEELLQRLQKVKKTGASKWAALCPAHEDGSPSLAIKDEAGTILLHCFAGCSPMDVCASVGISLTDLFPPQERHWQPGDDKPLRGAGIRFSAIDALRALSNEASVALLLACDMAEGKCLSPAEVDRMVTACSRMAAALTYLGEDDEIDNSLGPR